MIYILAITTAFLLLLLATPPVFAQGGGTEWDILNQEVIELYRTGKYDRGVVVAKKALEVAEKNVGPNHPSVAASLHNLALLYLAQGQYAQAEPLFRRALAIREKALGPDHPSVAQSLNNLAALYRATKRDKEAETLDQRAAHMGEEGVTMPSCAVCGKTITEKEMEKNIMGDLMGDVLGTNAKYMPNLMEGLAMKCNRCGAWICIRCAENAAMSAGAGMIKHSDCGGMFESP